MDKNLSLNFNPNQVIELQNQLVSDYNYKPLSPQLSKEYREIYRASIPSYLKENGDKCNLYNDKGTLIAIGYDRIVIGDYGAYIEFSKDQGIHGAYFIKPGQEYRLTPKYSNVKYYWLTTNDGSDIKIYFQKHCVKYADYKPEYFYVSVYEAFTTQPVKV